MRMIDERYCKLHVGDTIVLDASNFIGNTILWNNPKFKIIDVYEAKVPRFPRSLFARLTFALFRKKIYLFKLKRVFFKIEYGHDEYDQACRMETEICMT